MFNIFVLLSSVDDVICFFGVVVVVVATNSGGGEEEEVEEKEENGWSRVCLASTWFHFSHPESMYISVSYTLS